MTRMASMILFATLAISLTIPVHATGASSAPVAKGTTKALDAWHALSAIIKRADEEDLKFNPQGAIMRGDLRFAADFGDYISDAYLAKVEASLRQRMADLARVDAKALEGNHRIAFDVFAYQTRFALSVYESGAARLQQRMPLDHLFGQHIAFPQFSSGEGGAPFKTVADYENGLKRIDGFVSYLTRATEKMKKGIDSGHTLPRHIVDKIVGQLDEAIATPIDKNPFMQPALSIPAAINGAQRMRLVTAYRAAVTGKINPALSRLKQFMQETYRPAARTNAPGLAGLPDGAKLYAIALETHNTAPLNAEEVHQLGVKEVARIGEAMKKTRDSVGFKGSQAEFFEHLKNDARFKFASKDALLDHYRALGKDVDMVVGRLFASAPKSALDIKPVPAEQESSAGGAYYLPGTADGKRNGAFYINTSNLPTRTSPRATALYLHEGIPGHHFQGMRAIEDEALPANLRYGYNAAFGEGWALYAEWLGEEMGLYADPYQYFGRLEMEMFRAIRLVVDTGLHVKGWSREEAIRYFLDHSSLDRDAAEQEVDRYIVWPGQAVSYKVGELFIKRLRNRAEAALGARFDVKSFHEEMLSTGIIPLAAVEKKIDHWIERSAR